MGSDALHYLAMCTIPRHDKFILKEYFFLLSFAVAFFFLIVTPGPAVLSLAAIGAAFGTRPALSYMLGLFIGVNLVGLVIATGLAAVLLASDVIRTILLFLSLSYLVYLASQIAFAGSKIAFVARTSQPNVFNGITLMLINPKAYAVNTSLFTGFAFLPDNPVLEIIIKFLIMAVIWLPVHVLWMYAGIILRRLDLPAHTQRAINIFMAGCMLLVVALALFAQYQQ